MSHLPLHRLVILNLYGLALTMAVSVLDPPVFTAKINQLIPHSDLRNTTLGLLTFAGLVVAAASQPVWGALSDRTRSRWGRRRPFLVGGSLANLALFGLLALSGDLWTLALLVLLIQLASNAVQGAYQSLIPDHVPEAQRGVAAGVKTLVELPSVVVGPLVAGLLLSIAGWTTTERVLAVMLFLQLLYIAVTLIALRHIPDPPISQSTHLPTCQPSIKQIFHIDWQSSRDLRWWLVNRALFWFALLVLRTFLINYVEQVAGLSPEEAQRTIGLLAAVLGVLTFGVALPSGYLADRVGRRPLLAAAGLLAAGGAFVLLTARSLEVMFVGGIFIGLAGGLFFTSSWALATELVPQNEAARYLGIANLATAGGSAAARLTGPLIDGINHFSGSETLGYVSVYALAGVLFLLSSWAIRHVTSG